jgi:hypothetical protein
VGPDCTFEKRADWGSFFRTLLDRARASPTWSARYPLATVENLTAVSSDHSPILVWFDSSERHPTKRGRLFQYELIWEAHEEFEPVLKKVW